MEIVICKVTEHNLMEIITDPDTYVIKKCWLTGGFMMVKIKDADIGDLMNDANAIVKIVSK